MKLGIVGLPNVGKSTLFNCMTMGKAEAANYAFCTIDPNIGVATVQDERLNVLYQIYQSEKKIPAVIEFVDIAGLVKGASKGEGLGNKFLSHIREVDAIVHVVRCFNNENVMHVSGDVNPIRDIETIQLELMLADAQWLTKRIEKLKKQVKADKTLVKELEISEKLYLALQNGNQLAARNFNKDEWEIALTMDLLTMKPVLYAANVSEDDLANAGERNPYVEQLKTMAEEENSQVFIVCATIEEELAGLEGKEKTAFLELLGMEQTALDVLIQSCYRLLGLISYFTAGPKEVRAWTITEGTKAPQAAGKIHSDFEKGFIRAEITPYDELIRLSSPLAVKEAGLVRSEGKEYVVKDGDIILFRFNV